MMWKGTRGTGVAIVSDLPRLALSAFLAAVGCYDDPRRGSYGDGGGPRDGGDGDPVDLGIPDDRPQLSSQIGARAVWAVDETGSEVIPNEWVSSVSELAVIELDGSDGVTWDEGYGSYAVTFIHSPPDDDDQIATIYLPSQEPGSYEIVGWGGELLYVERGGFEYTTRVPGARGTLEIEGRNGEALWGRFSGRMCFVATPDANCYSFYEGLFSARVAPAHPALDADVPGGYPAVSHAWASHATWRLDDSGSDIVPNETYASVSEIPASEGVESYGAILEEGDVGPPGSSGSIYLLTFRDTLRDQELEVRLYSLAPGEYDVGGLDGYVEYSERDGFIYTTEIDGGQGTLQIEGTNGEAMWGTFYWRVCYVATPGSNCYSVYDGRFGALVQLPP